MYHSTHTDYTALLDMNPPDLSAPANRIVAPEMTAEPLSLSWLLSAETHTNTQRTHATTYPQQQRCNINSRRPLGSISLSPCLPASSTARDAQTALWHDSDIVLMLESAHNAVHFTLHYTTDSCLSVDPLREKIHVSFSPSFSRQDREGHKHRRTAAPLFKYVLIFQFDRSFFFRWNLRLIELMTLYIAR